MQTRIDRKLQAADLVFRKAKSKSGLDHDRPWPDSQPSELIGFDAARAAPFAVGWGQWTASRFAGPIWHENRGGSVCVPVMPRADAASMPGISAGKSKSKRDWATRGTDISKPPDAPIPRGVGRNPNSKR